jgi:hypothetical protein
LCEVDFDELYSTNATIGHQFESQLFIIFIFIFQLSGIPKWQIAAISSTAIPFHLNSGFVSITSLNDRCLEKPILYRMGFSIFETARFSSFSSQL